MQSDLVKYLQAAILVDLAGMGSPVTSDHFIYNYVKPSTGESVVSDEDVIEALKILESEGVLIGYHDPYARSRFKLADIYDDSPELDLSFDISEIIDKYRLLGKDWLIEVLENIPNSTPKNIDGSSRKLPASDRLVSLSDNQKSEASQTLEDIIKEFQKDHHFGNEWIAEKNALLKALENGKVYLDAKVIDVRIGTMMIIEPLQAIADKYKEAAINGSFSALAQKALEFFINLFAG